MNLIGLIGTIGIIFGAKTLDFSNAENQFKEKLSNLGFTTTEIERMSEEEKERFINMEVIKTKNTEQTILESEIINPSVKSDSEKNYYLNLTDDELKDAFLNDVDKYQDENHIIKENKSLKTKLKKAKAYTKSDGEKLLSTYISYVKEGSQYNIFVKQNLIWSNTPSSRFTDLFISRYTNNLRLAEINGKPEVNLSFSYKKAIYKKVGWKHGTQKYKESTSEKEIVENYDSNSQNFNHSIGDYVGFNVDLPKNENTNGSSQRYYLLTKKSYNNFNLSLEATFTTNFSTLTGTEMQAYYSHQTGTGHFDWGKISFQTSPPYIVYSTNIWVDDPTYDNGIMNTINISFE